MMKIKNYRLLLIILTVIMAGLAIGTESLYFGDYEYLIRTKRFIRILTAKERIAENCLVRFQSLVQTDVNPEDEKSNNLFSTAKNEGIALFQYNNNRLISWSDNGFDMPPIYDDSLFIQSLVFIQNGWFVTKKLQSGDNIYIALIRIRSDYGLENDLIKNGFEKNFKIPEKVGFSRDSTISAFNIYLSDGEYLFSLVYPEEKSNTYIIIGPILLWVLVFILILMLTREMVRYLTEKGRGYLGIILNFSAFILLYFSVLYLKKPGVLFNTELFSPFRFTMNEYLPSLGLLFLLSVLLATFSYSFYKYSPLPERSGRNSKRDFIFYCFSFMIGAVMILLFHTFVKILISSSNINFEPYKVLNINLFSLIGLATIFLLFLVPVFYLLKIFSVCIISSTKRVSFAMFLSLIVFPAAFLFGVSFDISIIILYVILMLMTLIYFKKQVAIFNMTVVFSILLGIYCLFNILTLSEVKETENLKVLAVSYTNENDPVAEHLLLDIWPLLSNDNELAGLMKTGLYEKEAIASYLQEKYFYGYWGNYDFNIVLCRNVDPLQLESDNLLISNCFKFFDDRIKKDGREITGTNFYFLENQAGRSYYTGRLFVNAGNGIIYGLFIELYSYVNSYQSGYPELLLDKNYQGFTNLRDYSFAKFINGELVLRTGDFPYGKSDLENIAMDNEYMVFDKDGYRHLLYTDGNVSVIIGKPELTTVNIIISFAYLFTFILLMSNIVLLIIKQPGIVSLQHFNFRQKLQLSFVAILLVSFVAIGVAVAFLSIKQYQTKHLENIKEKLYSTYSELDRLLSGEPVITTDWRDDNYASLNDLLIRLSNVFYSDINLYDLNGNLIATSRPEVFYRDLTSRRMNDVALYNLAGLAKTEYINKEKIGSLEYLSAYIPFYSINGKIMAYMNMPYFRMQSVLAKEISDMIVTITNFGLLLIVLTMSLVVFISGRLTSPLRMLGIGLASVEFGKKSEHLNYLGHDEIGDLVKQYNRMVDEIEESAIKLTRSEREYAWREMAKQIAHEIKNPLTPMKLNVQQLSKSWHDGAQEFEKILDRFTENQIEYIENLSSIASEFSSFAKMPRPNPVEIDLVDQINSSIELFHHTENVKFKVNIEKAKRAFVFADKEHLNGVFSNLIKNAIQSIPSGKTGLIKINLDIKGNAAVVSISDNGIGIPKELKDKMFTPNFTTKSSGMGLGLSIVKRFVETANGTIRFESEPGKGSVFYVELPLQYTIDKL
jgi:two-component system, NtrC family, nitrogen regulation sensor histidine kinase NtrY